MLLFVVVVAAISGQVAIDNHKVGESEIALSCRIIVQQGIVTNLRDAVVEVAIRNTSRQSIRIEYDVSPLEQIELTLLSEDGATVIDTMSVGLFLPVNLQNRHMEIIPTQALSRTVPLCVFPKAESIANGVYTLRISYESQNHVKAKSAEVFLRVGPA